MDTDNLPVFGTIIDKTQVPPIHQKRILAFVNHFVINTVTFLNKFVVNCEMKFINFERKLQKVESSLLIIEEKLGSISGFDSLDSAQKSAVVDLNVEVKSDAVNITSPATEIENSKEFDPQLEVPEKITVGVKASEDIRYKKYFKMLQFGVPAPAVKIKMTADGLDANVLDSPEKILENGIAFSNVNEGTNE